MTTRPSLLIACLLLCRASLPAADAPAKKPNLRLLVADDFGWADVGWHGGKFRTPGRDRLVREGAS
jgi:arylsulfatase B